MIYAMIETFLKVIRVREYVYIYFVCMCMYACVRTHVHTYRVCVYGRKGFDWLWSFK